MKHSGSVTVVLLSFFLLAQFMGLLILYEYMDISPQGEIVYKDLPIGARPPLDEETSYLPIIIAILIGTGIMLLLIKFGWTLVWKIWFTLAVVLSLTIAFGAWVSAGVAFMLALVLGVWKIFKPNFWVQNLTELFVYGGLAAIFVPILSLWSMSILLVLIALYDAYAVWKSKHMVTLATSQTKAKVFAGLLVPYNFKMGSVKKSTVKTEKVRTAVLGGGDIGFPLLFAGVVMKEIGLWQSLVIPFFALLGLGLLLYYAKEKKFYPAMPFIGAGCFVGLGVVWLISLFLN